MSAMPSAPIEKPTQEQFAAAVNGLPRRLRAPFIMANVLGMPRLEIAAVLGISVRCVEHRLTKALKRCRDRTA